MSSRALLRLLAAGVILLLLALSWQLYQARLATLEQGGRVAANLALALDGRLSAVLRRIESNLNVIAPQLPLAALQPEAVPRHQAALRQLLQSYLQQFPEVAGYFVWSADSGELLYGTSPATASARPSIAHRPGFLYLKAEPQARIAFSDAIRSSVTGLQTVAVYVPVRDAQGRLRAVLTATLNLERIAQWFEALQLSPRSVVYVRRSDDHKLLIRYPYLDREINQPIRTAISRRIDQGETAGIDRFRAIVDGEPRIYGFRKLEGYPFYVVVGLSESAVLQGWRHNAWLVGAVVVALGLVLLILIGYLARLERQRALAQGEAAAAHALLKDAIDSIPAGITIYGPDDRLLMGNRALLRIFEGIADLLQPPGRSFEEITRAALQRGFYPEAAGREEEWFAQRLRAHQLADGQPHELALEGGRWVEYSEHRTAGGYTVGSRIDISRRKRLEEELRALASTDELTGLPNRRQFMQRLEQELERVRRGTTRAASVLMLDLDHFKRVNDLHGHAAGDRLLQHFAELLRQELRSVDTAARMGGEEFAVILPGTDATAAQAIAQRICERLAARPLNVGAQQLQASTSVGVAAIDAADLSADAVLARADAALYRAKTLGRNRVEVAAA